MTRPEEEAGALAERLRAEGAVAIEAPAIEILPVEDTAELDAATRDLAAERFAWVSFSSPRAVGAVLDRLKAQGLTFPRAVRVAAVGPGTRKRIEAAGVMVDVVAEPHTTEALAEDIPPPAGPGEQDRILLPRADIAPERLEERLAERGWKPVRVVAYRTRFPERLPQDAQRELEAGQVDAVAFTSASTVEGFARMTGVREGPKFVCIGPVTADAARRLGFRVDAVAERHSVEGLVSALAHALGESG